MKTLAVSTMLVLLTLSACTSVAPKPGVTAAQPDLDTQLKVTSTPGRLKAKLTLKNMSTHEILVKGLDPQFFTVATVDNKPIAPKAAPTKAVEPLHLKPGQTIETAFNLQDNYPFWDRLTKYRIQYDAGEVKSNLVQVWY